MVPGFTGPGTNVMCILVQTQILDSPKHRTQDYAFEITGEQQVAPAPDDQSRKIAESSVMGEGLNILRRVKLHQKPAAGLYTERVEMLERGILLDAHRYDGLGNCGPAVSRIGAQLSASPIAGRRDPQSVSCARAPQSDGLRMGRRGRRSSRPANPGSGLASKPANDPAVPRPSDGGVIGESGGGKSSCVSSPYVGRLYVWTVGIVYGRWVKFCEPGHICRQEEIGEPDPSGWSVGLEGDMSRRHSEPDIGSLGGAACAVVVGLYW